MHRISPPTEITVMLGSLSISTKGQRLPGRARIACQGAGRRWPVAFGATARMVNRAQHDQGDGLGQTHHRIGLPIEMHRISRNPIDSDQGTPAESRAKEPCRKVTSACVAQTRAFTR